MPHVFTLLTAIILLASLLTHVVPSGKYERQRKIIDGRERTLVVPDTYEQIPKRRSLRGMLIGGEEVADEELSDPVSLHGFLTAIPRGMEKSADIIFFIFILGGVFGILQQCGTIPAVINKLLEYFGHSAKLLTVIIMVCLAV